MKGMLEALDVWFKGKLDSIHTVLPAEVLKVNGDLLDVQISVEIPVLDSMIKPKPVYDVPFFQQHGAKGGLFTEIGKGDSGIILVAECDIAKWKKSGTDVGAMQAKFQFNNSFFIPGIFPQNQNQYIDKLGKNAVALWAQGTMAVYNENSSLRAELEKVYKRIDNLCAELQNAFQAAVPQTPLAGSAFAGVLAKLGVMRSVDIPKDIDDIQKIFTEGGGSTSESTKPGTPPVPPPTPFAASDLGSALIALANAIAANTPTLFTGTPAVPAPGNVALVTAATNAATALSNI